MNFNSEVVKSEKYTDFFMDTQKAYNSLNDELSRKIFDARIQYIYKDSTSSLVNLISYNIKENFKSLEKNFFSSLNKIIEQLPNNSKTPVIIYGTKILANKIFYAIKDKNKVIFCDPLPHDNVELYGAPVITKNDLINNYNTQKIIVASYTYLKEITEFLISNNINKENIIFTPKLTYEELMYKEIASGEVFYADHKKQYFDKLINLGNNEVFVDAGVCDGNTTLEFINKTGGGV